MKRLQKVDDHHGEQQLLHYFSDLSVPLSAWVGMSANSASDVTRAEATFVFLDNCNSPERISFSLPTRLSAKRSSAPGSCQQSACDPFRCICALWFDILFDFITPGSFQTDTRLVVPR